MKARQKNSFGSVSLLTERWIAHKAIPRFLWMAWLLGGWRSLLSRGIKEKHTAPTDLEHRTVTASKTIIF